jgi:hypothetical protein
VERLDIGIKKKAGEGVESLGGGIRAEERSLVDEITGSAEESMGSQAG